MSGDRHEAAALRLADYAAGRLSGDERSQVEAHALQCPECRDMTEAYRLMAAAAAHPESSVLAERALSSEAALPADEVARHLASCAECAADLAAARAANRAAIRLAAPPRVAFSWLPLAAALAAGLLALGAFAAWRHAGALSRRLAAIEAENGALRTQVAELTKPSAPAPAEGTGVMSYLFLRGTERGAAAPARLTIPRDQPDIFLALALEVPATLRRPGEPGHLVLSDPEGGSIWETDVAAASLDAALSRGEALLVKIPSDRLRPGRHAIRLTAGEGRTWFRSEFETTPAEKR